MPHNFFIRYPYKQETAKVRIGTKLCQKEKAFIVNRERQIKESLKKHFNILVGDKRVPRVSICLSGGGGRTMVASLGSLLGAKDIGLLDCSMYQVGLSGSTWLIAPWSLMFGQKAKTLEDMKSMFERVLSKKGKKLGKYSYAPQIPKGTAINEIRKHIYRSVAHSQPISAVSMWGSLVGNTVLMDADNKFQTNWFMPRSRNDSRSIAQIIQQGLIPLPLCGAMSQKVEGKNLWFEFSPFEIACRQANVSIASWALGRKFYQGKSINVAPPMPLSYYLGIFGSGFEVEIKELLDHITITNPKINIPGKKSKIEIPLNKMAKKAIKVVSKDGHISPTDLPNFAYGVESSSLKGEKKLHLMDAGIETNIPLALAIRPEREIDLVVMLDNSSNIHNAPELRKAARLCLRLGYDIPKRITEKIYGSHRQIFTVFNHPNEDGYQADIPVIFYVPLWKNDRYDKNFNPFCNTENYCSLAPNFHYTKEGINKLSGLTRFVMNDAKVAIKDILSCLVGDESIASTSSSSTSTTQIDLESFIGPGMSGKDPECPTQPGEQIP